MKSDFFGILNINKPKGITSFDVVARVRKILGIKKVGHTGTLDPLAQGVLPVCVGDATRIIEFLPSDKIYRAYAKFGLTSNTYDTEGEITEAKPVNISKEEAINALKIFEGQIEQTPPIFSAIKIKGKKLYEYARKNEKIEIPSRKVTIYKITSVEWQNGKNPVLVFDIECSSGTYIRSIIHDLGQKLHCGAIMADLIRTKANNFEIAQSQELDALTAENAVFIDPLGQIALPEIKITSDEFEKIKLGQNFFSDFEKMGMMKLSYEGKLVGIAEQSGKKISPKKVFKNFTIPSC